MERELGKATRRWRPMMTSLTVAAAVGLAAPTVALAHDGSAAGAKFDRYQFEREGPLTDLQSKTAEPTDGAEAEVEVRVRHGWTTVSLELEGLDRSRAGIALGAHVHVGPCVADDGAKAGPHYKADADPPSTTNEVWLDFEIRPNGKGKARADVPFVIPPGAAASVVIHAQATDHTGAAGARWACLPVPF